MLMSRAARSCLVAMALSTALVVTAGPSHAETGQVHVRVVNMGFIVGAGGGEGFLTFRGKAYPFTVSGIGVGMIGAAAAELRGRAYNLRRPSDIAGTYSVIGAGAAVVGGPTVPVSGKPCRIWKRFTASVSIMS